MSCGSTARSLSVHHGKKLPLSSTSRLMILPPSNTISVIILPLSGTSSVIILPLSSTSSVMLFNSSSAVPQSPHASGQSEPMPLIPSLSASSNLQSVVLYMLQPLLPSLSALSNHTCVVLYMLPEPGLPVRKRIQNYCQMSVRGQRLAGKSFQTDHADCGDVYAIRY